MSKLKVSHYKIKIADPYLAPPQPFSMVVLADLHDAYLGEHNEELLKEIRSEDPKAILAAGDLVTAKKGKMGVSSATELLGELTRRYPVYYANGNHESRMARNPHVYGDIYERFEQEIKSLGVHFLRNAKSRLEIGRTKFDIYGYELDWIYYSHGKSKKLPLEDMKQALGEPEPGAYHILLAHNPNYFDTYAGWGADLTVSGHLHGGIVRLPKFGGMIGPDFRLFPEYDHGLYQSDGKRLIVSAGLASHTIKLRVNNPPELVVIDFL